MGRVLAVIGILLTILYGVFTWSLIGDRIGALQTMPLSEVGDFFAGVFGPVAILWLVLGFFQQGIELRQGTDALRLQTKELSNSVEQQCKMVAAQEVSLKNYERSLEPILHVDVRDYGCDEGDYYANLLIKNTGEYCESIRVKVCAIEDREPIGLDPLVNGATTWVRIGALHEREGFKVVVEYKTRSCSVNSQSFTAKYYEDEYSKYYIVNKLAFLS